MLAHLRDLFASFQRHDVRYVVIGSIAAAMHAVPRATLELDVLIEATPENARRLLTALIDADLGTALLTSPGDVLDHEITVFKDRVRIDVQTRTPGLVFEDAWANRVTMTYRGQEFQVASKADLIRSKRAAGRSVDLEDVRLLELGDSI